MLVRDIMHTEVKTATADTTIREVAVLMCFNKISGVPVVGRDNGIVGVISEKDILRAMYPQVDEYMRDGRPDFEDLEGQYRDILNLEVRDLMTPMVYTVAPDDPILKAASIMSAYQIRRIPVAVGNRLVGIVSIGDVHKAIFKNNLDLPAARQREARAPALRLAV